MHCWVRIHNHLLPLLSNFYLKSEEERKQEDLEWRLVAVKLRSCGIIKLHFRCKYWHKLYNKPTFCAHTAQFHNLHKHSSITGKSLVYVKKKNGDRSNWFQLRYMCPLYQSYTNRFVLILLMMILFAKKKPLQRCYFKKRQQRVHSSNLWKWPHQLSVNKMCDNSFYDRKGLRIKVLLCNLVWMMHESVWGSNNMQ